MTSVIYKIVNNINNKFYIGSSKNIEKRFKYHISYLNGEKHHNTYLQNSWKKHESDNFSFIIIEEVEENYLKEREQFYLDLEMPYNRNIGYNICHIVDCPSHFSYSLEYREKLSIFWKNKYSNGYAHPLIGINRSDESREKQSISMKKHYESRDGYWKNKERSEETKEKCRIANSGGKSAMFGKNGELHHTFVKQLKGENHPNWQKPAKNKKPVELIKNGESTICNSVKDAGILIGTNRATIRYYNNRIFNQYLIKIL